MSFSQYLEFSPDVGEFTIPLAEYLPSTSKQQSPAMLVHHGINTQLSLICTGCPVNYQCRLLLHGIRVINVARHTCLLQERQFMCVCVRYFAY